MYKKNNYYLFRDYRYPVHPNFITMPLVIFLILFATLQSSADTFAHSITMKKKGVSLTSVLQEFQKQSGYNVFYEASLMTDDETVSVNYKNTDVFVALENLLAPFQLGYKLVDKNIILHKKARSEEHTSELQSRGHVVCRLMHEQKKKLHILQGNEKQLDDQNELINNQE